MLFPSTSTVMGQAAESHLAHHQTVQKARSPVGQAQATQGAHTGENCSSQEMVQHPFAVVFMVH